MGGSGALRFRKDIGRLTTEIADKPARAYRHWTAGELEYLGDNYGLIRDKVLAVRLQREVSAIINIASRKHVVTRMDNFYTAGALAKVLGFPCGKRIVRWVKKGWLAGRPSAMSQGKKKLWRFSESGIITCLRRRPWLANVNDMEHHYFRTVVISEWQRDPWLTVNQVASLLGLKTPWAIYRYIARGWLKADRKPEGWQGALVIRSIDIEAFRGRAGSKRSKGER